MPASQIALITVAGGIYLTWVIIAVLKALTPDTDMDPTMWATGWPHEAPDRPLSNAEAHQAMQRHRGCDPSWCGRKAAAIRTLCENGKLVPDMRMSEVCR